MKRVLAPLLAVVLLASGCSLLPTSGAVHREGGTGQVSPHDTAQFAPPGPGKGDSPTQVVKGFMLAMTAVPLTTSVARSFLTETAQPVWNPNESTVVYQSSAIDLVPDGVRVTLGDAEHLDSRGGWLGGVGPGEGRLDLRLVRDGGEWRIANPPDAVVVPEWYLDSRFAPVNLYFFDQTNRVLVPERIYLPRGEQRASTLVRALLAGPGDGLAEVTRTAFPRGTQLDLSVPVGPDGTAEVPLSEQVLRLSRSRLNRVVAQLAWTLRQVPGLTRVRITSGDVPVSLPDGRRDFSVRDGDAFAPTVRDASDRLFGVDRGRIVADRRGATEPAPGPFGRPGFSLKSIAVSVDESRIAEVGGDGGTVFAWARNEGGVRRVYEGTDVLRPTYDMFDGLWLVDRTALGARVLHRSGGQVSPVDVPGVTGRDVRAFVVSRDGTRLVAVVATPSGDRLMSSALLRTDAGDLIRPTAAHRIAGLPDDLGRIVDLSWRSPNDLAVLGRSQDVSQVRFVPLDGSPGDPDEIQADLWQGRATGLAGSPDIRLPVYLVVGNGRVRRLDAEGHWVSAGTVAGFRAPTYAG
jgi:hypothetical protein